ncbi:hypothetical protein MtrunA17_Chr8g0380771 [Medicago truncatula]|uniref:Transmembrane protein n=1 Tax=Medicago truncatula TaxID=3880 RepID=A0A396GRJ6_MEDTR|nr:hypothetical protein MtrunA17_Chr8g0380771 [Medicago truncatula]
MYLDCSSAPGFNSFTSKRNYSENKRRRVNVVVLHMGFVILGLLHMCFKFENINVMEEKKNELERSEYMNYCVLFQALPKHSHSITFVSSPYRSFMTSLLDCQEAPLFY